MPRIGPAGTLTLRQQVARQLELAAQEQAAQLAGERRRRSEGEPLRHLLAEGHRGDARSVPSKVALTVPE